MAFRSIAQGVNYAVRTANLGNTQSAFTLCAHVRPPASNFEGSVLSIDTGLFSGEPGVGNITLNASHFYGQFNCGLYNAAQDNGAAAGFGGIAPNGTDFYFVAMTWNDTSFRAYIYRNPGTPEMGLLLTDNRSALTENYITASPRSIAIGRLPIGSAAGQIPDGEYTLFRHYAPANTEIAYLRYWPGVCLTPAELLIERTHLTPQKAGCTIHVVGNGNVNDSSGNNYHLTAGGTNYEVNANLPPYVVDSGGGLTKKIKLLTAASAVGQVVSGVAWANVAGIDVGSKYGAFSGLTVEAGAGADTGKGVLKIPLSSIGSPALNVGDQAIVYLENTTNFTPHWRGTVIEE